MRRLAQPILIVLLAQSFAPAPVFAGTTTSLGVVTGADKAIIGRATAVDGSSVYDGDTISTARTGTIRLRLGQSQLVLGGDTTVTLHKTDAGICATLQRGILRFSSVTSTPIEVRALDSLVVRAKGDTAVIGQVSLVAPAIFEVGSSKGDLLVSIDGTDHVVAESTAYRVSLDESSDGTTAQHGKGAPSWIWFPVLLAPLAIAIPVNVILESPSIPQ
ncbi:MAG: hypothetical protein WAM91_10665 [Candidatus Acidiferrales bacterium]